MSPTIILLLLLCISNTAAEIRFTKIRSDPRPIIPFDEFGFTHNGRLELNVTKLQFSSSNPNDLTELGFFLCTRDSWLPVLQQIEDGEITCALQSNIIKQVYLLNSVSTNSTNFSNYYLQSDSNQYTLGFANCIPELRVSMDVRSAMYNLEGKSKSRDYLSAGITNLPRVYFVFSLIYFTMAAAAWIWLLYKEELTFNIFHFLMLAVVILKAVNLVCEAEDKSYIKRNGSSYGWNVLVYIFSFLIRIAFVALIALVGTVWSNLKPFLHDRDKKVLMNVIPVQLVANIAQVIIDESGLCIIGLVDVVCCCAVLFPIFWSIKNLRGAVEWKSGVFLMKLTLFRQYYVVVICCIYFHRVVVHALETITSYKYLWTSVVATELATLAFYVFNGLWFMHFRELRVLSELFGV